ILLFLMKGSLNDESVKGDWIHLLPCILSLPFYVFFISHSDFRHDHGDGYFGYMYATTFASMIGYGSYSLLLWRKAGKKKKSSSLLFLREARSFVLFLALGAVLFFAPVALTTDFYLELQSATHVLLYLCVLFIGWKLYMSTYRRVRSDVGHRAVIADSIFSKAEAEQTQKAGADTLTTRRQREYQQGMQRFIRSNGFTNPDIDRQTFVAITKISPKHLHHFLQDQYGKSFAAVI